MKQQDGFHLTTVEYRIDKYTVNSDGTVGEWYDYVSGSGNLGMLAGELVMLKLLAGAAATTFANANANIGVGDGTAAAVNTQTDLQGTTKFRSAVNATYPLIGTGGGLATDNLIQFQSTFASGNANFHWQEWGVFNANAAGTMLNRKVIDLGTKSSAVQWIFTVTISIS